MKRMRRLRPGVTEEVRSKSRIENWDSGYRPDAIKTKLDSQRPTMKTTLTTIFANLEKLESQVRDVLAGISGADAPTEIQSPFYLAAAQEMANAKKHWNSGTAYDAEMAAIIAKWTARGLSATVLKQIAYEVFNWIPPGPQPK